jgi:hypothetical protein
LPEKWNRWTQKFHIQSRKIKIQKYDKVKRLPYLSRDCHALMIFLEHFIEFAGKNSNNWGLVKAFSSSELPRDCRIHDQSTEISSSLWLCDGVREKSQRNISNRYGPLRHGAEKAVRKEDKRQINKVFPHWFHRKLSAITKYEIQEFHDRIE